MKQFFQKIKNKIFQPAPQFAHKTMISEKELLKKVKKIEIAARSKLNLSFLGNYQTIFRGKGLEFDRVREYQENDEVRSIDWNVTARTGKLYVKNYTEERELNIYFLVDVSASAFFQFQGKSQREIAAEICCHLGLSALKNSDKVGLVLFSDRVEKILKAKKGQKYALQIVRELLVHSCQSRQTNIAMALDKLEHIFRHRSVIFLISDFLDNSHYSQVLQRISLKHEIVLIDLCIFFQKFLCEQVFLEIQDMESGKLQILNTYDQKWQKEQNFERKELQKFLAKQQPLYLAIQNYQEPVTELIKFFSPKSSFRKIGQTRAPITI